MASRSVAPGAALLRASRVFSVPPPLSRPADPINTQGNFNSDTATLPHPLHMSITTPSSSLQRGDWGLKRSLPLRSTTKTSTPIIKVKAMDTWEHITEFGSAADHTLTLQKWQEMNIPMTTPRRRKDSNFHSHNGPSKSVFESEIDTIFNAKNLGMGMQEGRWKYEGPWLAGQTDGEFNEYLEKTVRSRKGEFREFLRTKCAEERRKKQILEEGIDEENSISARLPEISNQDLEKYIKSLRRDTPVINKHIRAFFDLAPASAPSSGEDSSYLQFLGQKLDNDEPKSVDTHVSSSPYAQTGPPKTHPSAGLSYTRSAAKLHNHPLFGPQRSNTIVEARVVMPKNAGTNNQQPALGVAGIVANVPSGDQSFNYNIGAGIPGDRSNPLVPGLLAVRPNGGGKVWVQPKSANIDPKGKIQLHVEKADVESVAVKTETTEEYLRTRMPAVGQVRTVPTVGPWGVSKSITRSEILGDEGLGRDSPRGAAGYGLEFLKM